MIAEFRIPLTKKTNEQEPVKVDNVYIIVDGKSYSLDFDFADSGVKDNVFFGRYKGIAISSCVPGAGVEELGYSKEDMDASFNESGSYYLDGHEDVLEKMSEIEFGIENAIVNKEEPFEISFYKDDSVLFVDKELTNIVVHDDTELTKNSDDISI